METKNITLAIPRVRVEELEVVQWGVGSSGEKRLWQYLGGELGSQVSFSP